MTKTMRLELFVHGGGDIDTDITYIGKDMEEIARNIDRDNNELLDYLMTGDDKGSKAFCFGGFMFSKKNIIAARLSEPFSD